MPSIATVTGGAGFIATEIIKQLLEKGYHVRATTRSLENTSSSEHLRRDGCK